MEPVFWANAKKAFEIRRRKRKIAANRFIFDRFSYVAKLLATIIMKVSDLL